MLEVTEATQQGTPLLDIMVPTHNRLDLTMRCLQALYFHTQSPFHLIVCDASDDGMTEIFINKLRTAGVPPLPKVENLTYIKNSEGNWKEGNQFFNIALQYCKTEYMATVMNSVRVEPDWELFAIHNLMAQNPNIGLIGFKCLFGGESNKAGFIESAGIRMVKYLPADVGRDLPGHRLTGISEPDAVQWAFALLRVKAARGNLEEGLFHGHRGWDDIDNCFALKAKGWKIVYCGMGCGYHEPRASRGDNSQIAERENRENGIKFYKRWGLWEQFLKDNPEDAPLHNMPKEVRVAQELQDRTSFAMEGVA